MTSLDAQLDDFLASRWLPAMRSPRIVAPDELPVRLETYIRTLGSKTAWRAYADSGQVFCAIGRISWLVSRKFASGSLEVCFLDSSAKPYSTGIWQFDRKLGWRLDSIPEFPHVTALPGVFPATGHPIRWTT